jgi:hypothetical protein
VATTTQAKTIRTSPTTHKITTFPTTIATFSTTTTFATSSTFTSTTEPTTIPSTALTTEKTTTSPTTLSTTMKTVKTSPTTITTSSTTLITTDTTTEFQTFQSTPYETSSIPSSTLNFREITSDTENTTYISSTHSYSISKKCNSKGDYNGKYEIKFWPLVDRGENSTVHCPQGNGYAKWQCMDNYMFDNNGPDWSECNKWIDELHPIKSIFYASEVIFNNTEKNNSLITHEKMTQVMDKIKDIQNLFKNQTDNSLEIAKSIAKKMIRILSNILEQKYAWINSTVEQKISTSSDILKNIQLTGFMVAHQQDIDHKLEIIKSKNIHLNSFYFDTSEELFFPNNVSQEFCSINIPKEIKTKNNTEFNKAAVGAIIYKIRDYILGGMTEDMEINSEVLLFSLNEGFNSTELNKEVKIR